MDTQDGCHNDTTKPRRDLKSQTQWANLLQQTAHFFFICATTSLVIAKTNPKIVHIAAISDKVICITTLREYFPSRAIHTPPFRPSGMTRQPSFLTIQPSTKQSKNQLPNGGYPQIILYQNRQNMSRNWTYIAIPKTNSPRSQHRWLRLWGWLRITLRRIFIVKKFYLHFSSI